jgi:hypothetical protein
VRLAVAASIVLVTAALAVLVPAGPVQAQTAARIQQQDDDFLAARDAFRIGNAQRLDQAAARLRGYPLEPWVHYWQLRLRLDTMESSEVQSFLGRNANSRVADQLRADWMKLLGRRGQWDAFGAERALLVNGDTELDCYALTQRKWSGDTEALREARAMWFTGRDLPESCTPLFQELINNGDLKLDDLWARMRLALDFIGIEHVGSQLPLAHCSKLPGQIEGVAHAAVHALPGKRWREVRRIAGENHPAHLPALGHAGMEGVDHLAHNP